MLDTLAHCYAAKGDYVAAVKAQTEANRLILYSQHDRQQAGVFPQQAARRPSRRMSP